MSDRQALPDFHPPVEAIISDIRQTFGHFAPNQYQQLGDADSAHGVLFGTMADYGAVAIKPFSRLVKARIEAQMIDVVRQRGFRTLDPLTIASGGLGAYLVTRYQPNLRHLGQVDWCTTVASNRIGSELAPTLHAVGRFAGDLHGAGIVHGDLKPKNAVFDNTGKPVAVDLEKALRDRSAANHAHGSDEDLRLFGSNVLGQGLLHDRSPSFRAGFLRDHLIQPAYDAAHVPHDERAQRQRAIQTRWIEQSKWADAKRKGRSA